MTIRRSPAVALVLSALLAATLAACTGSGGDATGPSPASAANSSARQPSSTGSPSPSPSAPSTLQETFRQVRTGVLRLEVSGCDSPSTGTGFAIEKNLVITAAHVVDGGRLVRAINGTTSRAAAVVGIDREIDVALLELVSPVDGHRFDFADLPAEVGEPVAALGYPAGAPLALSPGSVNAVNRKVTVEGQTRYGMVEFDSAIDHGNSGGPLIRSDGTVVGVVDAQAEGKQGRKLAVSAKLADLTVQPWQSEPAPLPTAPCPRVVGPEGATVPAAAGAGSHLEQVFGTLNLYFRSINDGDYPTALAQLINPLSLDEFTDGVESSQDSGFRVRSVTGSAQEGRITVWLTFTSRQHAGQGPRRDRQETCTDWSLDYVMRPHNGLWLIDTTRAHGAPDRPCAGG